MGTDNIRMTETGDVRQQILEVLLKERDAFISGNELSQRTGVSRTAVWKHIKALETAGFRFASSTRVGYRLTEVPDLLFPALVAERVPAGQHIGRKVVWYSEVDSTNRVAADWVQENAPHGTVVTAETQTGEKDAVVAAGFLRRADFGSVSFFGRQFPCAWPLISHC
ncbi:hypothetical protein GCM10025857_00760 [Alicyclobacillus contaminans]|nr:hypothetical protein GCM10025857_00760 [Alicyclobacillus contaminans]